MSEDKSDVKHLPSDYAADLFSLKGLRAAVTGAGSGLGAAISVCLAQAGAAVELLDFNDQGLAATERVVISQGGTARARHGDVTDSASVQAVEDSIRTSGSTVDILVHTAGTAYRCAAEESPEAVFGRMIASNLEGTHLACQIFGRPMLAQSSGSIPNMASIGGFIAYQWTSAYLASKGGGVQLTNWLASEWGHRGAPVSGIGHTLKKSVRTRRVATTTSITADFIKARTLRPRPRPRPGLPEELFITALLLASPTSALVNEQTLMCDDGYLTA